MCFNNRCGCNRCHNWNNWNNCGCGCGCRNNFGCSCSNPFVNCNGCCSRTFVDTTTTV